MSYNRIVGNTKEVKQTVEGYLFWTNGCEHGPSIMHTSSWDQALYEELESEAWCDNEFLFQKKGKVEEGKAPEYIFEEVDFDLKPGTKYRITVEEIK